MTQIPARPRQEQGTMKKAPGALPPGARCSISVSPSAA